MKTRAGGRPAIAVTAKDIRQIERMARLLLREESIAQILGWSAATLYRRKKDTPEVLTALKKGRAKAELEVAGKLMAAIRRGNVGAIVWAEKSRFGYRERMEVSGFGGGPIPHEDLSMMPPADRKARIAELLAAGAARAGADQGAGVGEPEPTRRKDAR